MTTNEGNALIAEFMGQKSYWNYEDDWNILMHVVEKIESIYDDHHGYFGVYLSSNTCVIQGTKFWLWEHDASYGHVYQVDVTLPAKIEATWHCIINFIKWYKQYKDGKASN